MLLSDETKCFCLLAGHESFAAAEGAIGIARSANRARTTPLKVILNGLGKDAAQIISRINGFTYVQTQFDYYTSAFKIVKEWKYSFSHPCRVHDQVSLIPGGPFRAKRAQERCLLLGAG